ncbi:MAG TPA: hypothetical protein VHY22_12570 [Chthoniobacteraceae bacterium]|nr:hypothetical protein [Chthoniobacteraceae bacterium]
MDDPEPHGAALNMAIDEVLLAEVSAPVLRVYRWERPAVSFGYFEAWAPVRESYAGRDAVRRWTGGGVVPHGADFTYSLLIPRGLAEAAGRCYEVIHAALRAALAEAGIHAMPAVADAEKRSRACFENPVTHDVVIAGRKVAGAAQRRTRAGLLHQGSVQGLGLPERFGAIFAARLACRVHLFDPGTPAEALELAARKYGTREWLERR